LRGRKNTPTALKVLTGNPGHRPLNDAEPEYDNVIPECPLELDEVGLKEWDSLSKTLVDAGVLTVVDANTLAVYCWIWSQITYFTSLIPKLEVELNLLTEQAAEIDNDETAWHKSRIKTIKKDIGTARSELRHLSTQNVSYSALFGLDPSSRGKIRANKPPKKNEEDSLFD